MSLAPRTRPKARPTDRWTVQALKLSGFTGGLRVADLQLGCRKAGRLAFEVPRMPGVYLLVRHSRRTARFSAQSCGGRFKGRDPTLPVGSLRKRWVHGAKVLYIGKAGGATNRATLYSRIRAYMRFGLGEPISHWGGRCIWQLTDAHSLRIYWKPTARRSPREVEKRLLAAFLRRYGRLPFANLIG